MYIKQQKYLTYYTPLSFCYLALFLHGIYTLCLASSAVAYLRLRRKLKH